MAVVVKTVLGSQFGWQVKAPHILEPIVGIGMFSGGTIWILAHGQIWFGSISNTTARFTHLAFIRSDQVTA